MKQGNILVLGSVNIELDSHLDSIPRLRELGLDVLMLQEVCEKDLALFARALGMQSVFFAQMALLERPEHPGEHQPMGIAILSRLPARLFVKVQYGLFNADYPDDWLRRGGKPTECWLLGVEIKHNRAVFRFATIHGCWTPGGLVIIS